MRDAASHRRYDRMACVPQWVTQKGNRPSFSDAAPPEEAELRYDRFCEALAGQGVDVARGAFGARMAVELVNDGPVTIILG